MPSSTRSWRSTASERLLAWSRSTSSAAATASSSGSSPSRARISWTQAISPASRVRCSRRQLHQLVHPVQRLGDVVVEPALRADREPRIRVVLDDDRVLPDEGPHGRPAVVRRSARARRRPASPRLPRDGSGPAGDGRPCCCLPGRRPGVRRSARWTSPAPRRRRRRRSGAARPRRAEDGSGSARARRSPRRRRGSPSARWSRARPASPPPPGHRSGAGRCPRRRSPRWPRTAAGGGPGLAARRTPPTRRRRRRATPGRGGDCAATRGSRVAAMLRAVSTTAAHHPWVCSVTARATSTESVRACSATRVAESRSSRRRSSPRSTVKWPSSSAPETRDGQVPPRHQEDAKTLGSLVQPLVDQPDARQRNRWASSTTTRRGCGRLGLLGGQQRLLHAGRFPAGVGRDPSRLVVPAALEPSADAERLAGPHRPDQQRQRVRGGGVEPVPEQGAGHVHPRQARALIGRALA